MGIVWLARDDELERDVALKFLPELLIHDPAVLNGLKRETNRSLELTHKNIVRIYDFVHDDNSACISMEYIDGGTLSNLRADKERKVFETYELTDWMKELCEALEYAHNHAHVVHRDLKPSNLMVNKRGDLKVADFGIARSLSDSVSALTIGRASGTLLYMSPQQLNGERATPGDDVYSTGATIYELLTSKPPFYSGNIDRQIRENIPPTMRQRRKELEIDGEPIGESWERIVAACLQKDPASRPQSVTEIAEGFAPPTSRTRRSTTAPYWKTALSRWKTIVAKDPMNLQRRVKQSALGLSALFIVALVIWQLSIQREMKAELIRLRKGIAEYPQVEADVRGSHAGTNAEAVQDQTYAKLGKQLGVDPKILREKLPRTAEELKQAPNASTYERANASYVVKDYAQAEALALQAADEIRRLEPGNSKGVLQALELAGLAARSAVQYSRAMQHFRDAEKLTDRTRNLEEWVTLQQDIADLLVIQGDYANAERLFRSVIDARSLALGPEHPDTLDSRHRLIYALTWQSKYGEAETEAREVLRLREKILGPEHVDTIISRYNLAEPLVEQGKYTEAEALYREVIRLGEKTLGSEHPRTIAARLGLATVLSGEGKGAEAEALYREVIRLDEKVYGSEHPNTLNDRMNLATALQANGKYSYAEAEYRDVINQERELIGLEHPDTLMARNNLAEVLDDEGKYPESEAECRQIVDIETKVLGPENRLTLNTRGNLAIALIGQAKFPDAETEYKNVLNLMESVLGLEHPDTLSYASKFAEGLARQDRMMEARALAKHLQEVAVQKLGPNSASARNYGKLLADVEATK